jgi:hypothetical protein
MSINKIYLNQKYNTIYYPFSDDGNYSNNFTIKKYNNFGNEKRVSIGGGKVESTDFADTLYYGQYCKARAILGFDTSTLDKSISANSPVSMLRLYNLYKWTEYTPASITIEILPLTGDWSAGTQTSADLTVTGGSSWEYKNSSEVWGDNNDVTDLVDYSLSASAELTPSNKHIEVNISTMINYCLENDYRIYGVVLKLTSEQESSTANSYFIKNIYTGDFTMLNKLPRIDITTTNYIHDDRNSILAGQSSRLYFYNMVNGTPSATNADSASVTIVDRDETTIIDSVSPTADSNNTGYYYVDFTFPVSAWEQNGIYNDKWTFNYDGTSLIKTGEFNVTSPINNSFEILDSNKLSLVFIKEENKRNMHVKLKVKENKFLFFNKTSKEDDANNYNIKEVYYRVYTFDTSTGEREKWYVSDWDRMSYDKESIWCDIDKTIFPIGKYFIEFKFNLFGKELYYADKKYFFSIEEDFINTSLYY